MAELADIPGLRELWARTRGDPRVKVGFIDGPPDLSHDCFAGVELEIAPTYWGGAEAIDEHAIPEMPELLAYHGSFTASVILGREGGPVPSIAPRCRGVSIPVHDSRVILSPVDLARAFDQAQESGASVLLASACNPSASCRASDMLARSVRRAVASGMLIVSPVGNDHGETWCFAAALPGVLAAGALDDDGTPRKTGNFGGIYAEQGLLAPGEKLLGAKPGNQVKRDSGSCCSAAIVAGVAALLVSLQLQEGLEPDPAAVGRILLETARAPAPDAPDRERYLRGILDLPAAVARVLAGPRQARVRPSALVPAVAPGASPARPPAPPLQLGRYQRLVYAIGRIGYDFGSEARLRSLGAAMAAAAGGGPASPEDPRQLVAFLRQQPGEALGLRWTLEQDDAPVYVLEPAGPYAASLHETLGELLAAQVGAPGAQGPVDQVSVPGVLIGRRATLRSGERVPVVQLLMERGLYGWSAQGLVERAAAMVPMPPDDPRRLRLRRALETFLQRIYHDLLGLGFVSRERALNFAATNVVQATMAIAAAVSDGFDLVATSARKSQYSRPYSNCWDVDLEFRDPEATQRGRRFSSFTIDVADLVPVGIEGLRTWAEA